jgi:tetratricopeptide (TPR) repeat protein
MKTILGLCLLSLALAMPAPVRAQVQKEALAQEYFRRGEFDKALELYRELRQAQPDSEILYRYYFDCQLALGAYEELEKELRKLIRKEPGKLAYRVDLGQVYLRQGQQEQGQQQFEDAIRALGPDRVQIVQLAQAFAAIEQYSFAIGALEAGSRLLRNSGQHFHYELAGMYQRMGDRPRMIASLLDYLEADYRYIGTVQAQLQRELSRDEDLEALTEQLYSRIQKQPNDERWPEMLTWHFIQVRDFQAAFQQVRALDRRLSEHGQRVYQFAQLVQAEQAWDAAIAAYDYLIAKGRDNPYYFSGRNGAIDCRQQKLISGSDYTRSDVEALTGEYRRFLSEYTRRDARSADAIRNLARLHAVFLHQLDSAIVLVEGVLNWSGLRPAELAPAKLDLGDYLLMKGDVWESTLLYSQVDKGMKDEPLGEMARFLNARHAYLTGDFDWAQAQLEVLKASTSELVANDALQLSVFISANLGLDTSDRAMQLYARADMLRFQRLFDEAETVLDTLEARFPGHLLGDDVLWLRADMADTRHDVPRRLSLLEKLVAEHSASLLADDALFALGRLYEEELDQPDKAMEAYERILLEHSDSIYVTEARKRYRALRGDAVN